MMGRTKGGYLLSVLVVFGLASPAFGAGMWNLDQGASHYGRGGANIADPGDPSAVYINPAGLAGLKGLQFSIGGNLNLDTATFERASDMHGPGDTERSFESSSNQEMPSPSPTIFASYNLAALGIDSLTMGLGIWGPPKTNREWDEEGSQRYSSLYSRNLQAHYVFSLGYELPWQKIRLGASLGGTSVIVDSGLKLNVYEKRQLVTADKEDPRFDMKAALSGADHLIPDVILGFSMELWKDSTFAVSYQLPFDVSAEGEVDMEPAEGLVNLGTEVTGKDIEVQLALPPILRVALNQKYSKGSVELAYVWEGWKRADKMVIVPDDISIKTIIGESDLPVIAIDTLLRDTYSFRVGGDYAVNETVTVRAGTYYERAGIGGGRLNPSQFDLDKVGLTTGAHIDVGHDLYVDLALGWAHWLPKTVENSKVVFNDPSPNDPPMDEHWPLGNGTYSNDQIFCMFALGGEFDL
jgi:long-chain fatty acid transport protein